MSLRLREDARLSRYVAEALDAADVRDTGFAFVLDLATLGTGCWRADEPVYPASVIKVPIMAEAYRQFASGELRPDQPIVVGERNQTTTAEPTPFAPGYRATVQELVRLMITHSDNIAANELIDVLERERVTYGMQRLGLATFHLGRKLSGSDPLIEDPQQTGRNRMPPAEIGLLLALIAMDQVPGATEQRAILRDCVHNDKLVPALWAGDRFFHKTGDTDDVNHDAGILETAAGKRYVVVLYTTPGPRPGQPGTRYANPKLTAWMRQLRERL